MPTTVTDRWQKVALLKAALNEMSEYVPELQHTAREIHQVACLKDTILDWVKGRATDMPATFNLGCYFLGVDAGEVRRALRI